MRKLRYLREKAALRAIDGRNWEGRREVMLTGKVITIWWFFFLVIWTRNCDVSQTCSTSLRNWGDWGKAGYHHYYIIGQSCDYSSSFIVIIIITRPDGKAAYQPKLWAGNELGGWKPGRRCPSKSKNIQSETSFNICKHHTFAQLVLGTLQTFETHSYFLKYQGNPGGQWDGKSYGILMWSGNEVRRLKTSDWILQHLKR